MASKSEIANRGLIKLGQPRISNIETDPSPNAIIMNSLFDNVRDEILQSYPWNFSIKRADIAADVVTPTWGWDNAFSLPVDCLRILEIKDVSDYSVENNKILCDENGPIYIKYIYRVSDTALFPSLFNELFSITLAIQANEKITNNQGLQQTLIMERKEILERASSTDAIENPPEYFEDDAWLVARL